MVRLANPQVNTAPSHTPTAASVLADRVLALTPLSGIEPDRLDALAAALEGLGQAASAAAHREAAHLIRDAVLRRATVVHVHIPMAAQVGGGVPFDA